MIIFFLIESSSAEIHSELFHCPVTEKQKDGTLTAKRTGAWASSTDVF